jgi:hypothetical protein
MAVRWNGGSRDGLWSDGGNWTGGQVPGPGDAVIIDLTGTESVLLDVDASIKSLGMPEGGVLNMAGHTLATAAGVNLGAGAVIAGFGTLDIGTHLGGAGTVEATGLLVLNMTGTIASTIHLEIGTNADLKIEGSPTFAGGDIAVGAGNELEIANAASLTLGAQEVTTGGTIQLDGGTLKDSSGIVLGGLLTGSGTVATGNTMTNDFQGGTVVAEGGRLEFTGAVDLAGAATNFTIGDGATLAFDKAVGTTGLNGIAPEITFAGGAGTLDLSHEAANTYHGALTDFLAGDKIVVAGGNDTVTRIGNDVIEVQHGNTVEAIISLGPNMPGFEVTSNGTVTTITAICFMAGTMIRTPTGEAAVETLRRGDLVCTHEGAAAPVAWLGRQTISTVFADPMRVWPVRIKAGAIGENVPSRDLVLSPGHAVLIDGALVLASALVNGTSILREASVPEIFTYYHVELDAHALILAENTPAETFIDHVDRLAFDNWDEHQALYPVGRDIAELPYPVAKSHRQVPAAIRQKIVARAALIGAVTEAVA